MDEDSSQKSSKPTDPSTFWAELKRRKVMRVGITYAVVGWLVIQVANATFSEFGIPLWAYRFVVLMLILGFPVALIITWAFEVTPDGIKTTQHAREDQGKSPVSENQQRKRNWLAMLFAAAVPTVIFAVFALFFNFRIDEGDRATVKELPVGNDSVQQVEEVVSTYRDNIEELFPRSVRKYAFPTKDLDRGYGDSVYPSPNGKYIAFSINGKIRIRNFEDLGIKEIEHEAELSSPTLIWSPDSESLAFPSQEKLWKVPVTFGDSVLICDLPGTREIIGGSWGKDGTIVFTSWRGDMYRVSADGDTPESLLEAEAMQAVDFHIVDHLPDGSLIFDVHTLEDAEKDAEGLKRLVDGKVERLSESGEGPVYSPTGHIFFTGSSAGKSRILALPYSVTKGEVTGEPFVVANPGDGARLTDNGLLVYLREHNLLGEPSGPRKSRQLVWLDQEGQNVGAIGEGGNRPMVAEISPDGSRIAYIDGEKGQLWSIDLERQSEQRINLEGSISPTPLTWTQNGEHILFSRRRGMEGFLYALQVDGGGIAFELFPGLDAQMARDGKHLVYEVHEVSGDSNIWICPLPQPGSIEGPLNPVPLIAMDDTPEEMPRISPDAQFLVFAAGRNEKKEIYMTRFPSAEGRWQLSRGAGGGFNSCLYWSPDGHKIYYTDANNAIVEVEIETQPRVILGTPKSLFTLEDDEYILGLSNEGRFLANLPVEDENAPPSHEIVIVENWFEEFRDR